MRFPAHFEASISREEFLRLLPAATGDTVVALDHEHFGGRGWRLRLLALPPLRLGLVCLPRHRVSLFFEGLDEAAQERFLERFGRYYQRGGG